MDKENLFSAARGQQAEQNQEKGESPLISLKKDLLFYKDAIKEVAIEIMVEGVSAYPIFIAHQHEVSIGQLILDRKELNTLWTIHASTLEEFIEKGIIKENKKEAFLKTFKDASEYACIFAIVPEGANFVYYPYSHLNNSLN